MTNHKVVIEFNTNSNKEETRQTIEEKYYRVFIS